MPHFRSDGFPGKTTFFVSGKATFLLPNEPAGDQSGEISAVNGVEMDWTEMCASWEAQPGMLHLQASIAGAPCGWPNFLSGSVLWSLPCGVHSESEFPLLGRETGDF